MKSKQFFKKLKEIKNNLFKRKITSAAQKDQFMKKISRNGVKDFLTKDDSLSIKGKLRLIKEDINKEARSILKKAINEPEILLEFIKSKDTVIVKSRYMDRILALFREKEGFLVPMNGFKALIFTLIINIFSPVKLKFGFKTPALFALKDEAVNIYILSHQFHLWLSYINNLPGFDEQNMKNFKNFWQFDSNTQNLSYLKVDEIMSLQDIIARELEALDFVKEMARELVGQKESLKKIQQGKRVDV